MSGEGEGRQQKKRSKQEASGQTAQEKKEQKHLAEAKWAYLEQNKHLFQRMESEPAMFQNPEYKFIREFISMVELNRDIFPRRMGDKYYDAFSAPVGEDKGIMLTKGYVTKVAQREDTSAIVEEPILQVVERETRYRGSVAMKREKNGPTSVQIQFTHLRLCDGDGNIIVGRVVAHLTHEARKLNRGDIIKLPLFTELTHRMGTSKPMPAVFIAQFEKIGYAILPQNLKSEPLVCDVSNESYESNETISDDDVNSGNLQKDVSKAVCEFPNRLCSINGINMVICICKSRPVESLDLNTLREDCYFANEKVEDMTNSQKRCMIYWWYATNIYSICGKGKRMKLPDCLVKAVRNAYPESNGQYVGYCFACVN
mmetsp:Transcript_25930/g.38109  ORF Transcript_25930/g.38109 Transcript_25930/m.38109 type:complete len:370 (-) Transcript_25930:2533-3642(-)